LGEERKRGDIRWENENHKNSKILIGLGMCNFTLRRTRQKKEGEKGKERTGGPKRERDQNVARGVRKKNEASQNVKSLCGHQDLGGRKKKKNTNGLGVKKKIHSTNRKTV